MAEQEVKAQGASLNTMLTYCIGSKTVGINKNLLGTFLLIYFNQVLGLPAILAASAMAIALVVDAISDPIVGIWSDRVRSRWGRRHPFIYAAIIPFALSYYFILQNPGSVSAGEITESELFTRLLILMIIMRLSMTFYEVPRGALQPELKKNKYITSLLFKLKSKPAALYSALSGFAIQGINLTKLQSYPEKNSFTSYFFLCDLDGHIDDQKVKKSLEELGLHCDDMHILGVYESDKFREK